MSSVEILIRAIVDKAIADLKKTSGAVDEVGDATQRSVSPTMNFAGAMVALNQGIELVQKAVGALKAIHEATVGTFIEYADQVRNITRATGESAEEASRLIQAADDVGIAYDKLQMSLQMAARQGIDTSVESLKAMSEEYLTLAPGTERMQFVLENFGRAGADMGRLLEQGAEGIDKLTASIEGGLVLSDDVLKQARMHEILTDELNDQIEAQKVLAGITIGGIQNSALLTRTVQERINTMIDEEAIARQRNFTDTERMMFIMRNAEAVREQVLAEMDAKVALENSRDAVAGLTIAEEELAAAKDAVTAAQGRLEAAQQSWMNTTANQVDNALKSLSLGNEQYAQALGVLDQVFETNKVEEKEQAERIAAITQEFQQTGDIQAFADAMAKLKDDYMPETTAELEKTRSKVEELRREIDLLKGEVAQPIRIRVELDDITLDRTTVMP